MTPVKIIFWAALLPGTIALLGAFASRFSERSTTRWLVAAGVTGGYMAGQLGIVGWQGFDGDVTHGLLVLALMGAFFGALESFFDHGALRWTLRVVGSLAASWLLLRPLLPTAFLGLGGPSNTISPVAWPVLSLIFLAVWSALHRLAAYDAGRLLPALLVLLTLSGGATVLFAGNATTGALSGPLAATLGAIFVVGLFFPREGLLRPAVPAIALVMVGQWSIGHFYTDHLSVVSVGLLVGGPTLLALAAPLFPPMRRVLAVALQLSMLALPAAAAAGVAAMSYFSPPPTVVSPKDESSSSAPSTTTAAKGDDDYGY
ncbi:MAG: hypothetical protein JRH20_10805 [Deltaproteobacteria bacterium]|nr:hypothetical protein [Deltaproteobacteria bacterium]